MKIIIITGILIFITIPLTGCFNASQEENGEGIIEQTKKDRAITSCQIECKEKKEIEDFSQGPCLNNSVQPDWVCDIAHEPRQVFDNDPVNQCSAYREGTAHHFVELDLTCRLIRAQ